MIMKELGFEYLAEALPTPTHYPGRFAPRKSRVRPLPAAKAFLDQLTLQTGPWISRHALTRPRPRPRGRRRFRHNLVLNRPEFAGGYFILVTPRSPGARS